MSKKIPTQYELIMEYYKNHPNREIEHPEIVDWVTQEYKKLTGKVFRDPDRSIRKLAQSGKLIKVKKGVYKYDPDFIENPNLEDFSQKQKETILKQGNYKCAICGKGRKDGVELHVDHIKPKDFGGKATIENGQVLCAKHNFLKKNLKQTETGKKMFINLYQLAKVEKDKNLTKFCSDILNVFEEHDINGHIEWEK